MKTWEKPELYVEEFELSQHVAAGCGTVVTVKPEYPGGVIKNVEAGCYDNGKFMTGQGHWHFEGEITDTNKNGEIDWDEFTAAAGTAQNGVPTGGGHANHTPVIKVDGVIIETTDRPFSS